MRLLMGLLLLGRAAEEAAANPFGCAPGAYRPDVQLTAGRVHTCAVLNDSSVRCWGQNWDGMLGLGDTLERGGRSSDMGANLPAMDLGPGRIAVQLSAGEYHTCALLDNGSVKCWGSNAFGQLGLGDTQRRGIFPNDVYQDKIQATSRLA
ncbi:regulator of chromosome condensation 1/beta-lactamase-inhibitor protein II [Baffinella frigidus]|nr:regulator of chromosome condensation 1/beta-lactamase-inhibitor protein II [Cryptophyta sp. CCMP2293]